MEERDDEESSDGVINQWTVVHFTGNPPRQRSLHVGIVVNDGLYIFGGYDGSNRVNDFYKFDFKTSRWSLIMATSPLPSARDRHITVSYQQCIYIFGGYDGNNRVNDFWQFDTISETWSLVEGGGTPPTPRHSHSGIEYNGSMYIFAGYDGNYRSDFHQFDFATKKWSIVSVKGAAPKARYRTSAVAYKNKMLVVGGHDGAKHLNDFYQFNFDTLVWSLIEFSGSTLPPSPRDSHSAVIFGDSMYLFGGSTGAARNDLYEFRFDTKQWREIRPAAGKNGHQYQVPCARFCHTGVVYNSSLYIFGGYDGQNRLNDFKQFKLADEVNVEIPCSSLIVDLRDMLNDAKFSDVTFIIDGKPVHAHKLMCSRCSYFRAMFEGRMKESQQKNITINNVSHGVFVALLEYLYTDDIEINLDMAMDLFVAADQFGVERLKKLCEKKILVSINIENASTILQAANLHHATGLRQSCLDFILRNFDVVSKTSAFEEMGRSNVELVFEILKRR
eukprot:GEMP01042634.1.p1 GENE.GEMP01042634.1~~GEMP01042634.1.p1  ORF type:complete len:502 (+),score=78.77 GEMP01042634.1:151-1656(+)